MGSLGGERIQRGNLVSVGRGRDSSRIEVRTHLLPTFCSEILKVATVGTYSDLMQARGKASGKS